MVAERVIGGTVRCNWCGATTNDSKAFKGGAYEGFAHQGCGGTWQAVQFHQYTQQRMNQVADVVTLGVLKARIEELKKQLEVREAAIKAHAEDIKRCRCVRLENKIEAMRESLDDLSETSAESHKRALLLADECGRLRDENRELLAENARLRRGTSGENTRRGFAARKMSRHD